MASKSGAESDGKRLRKNWSDDSMLAAMEAVRTSQMSISVAANRFKVPRKTLDDRLKGRVQHGSHPGVSTVLTVQEENSLVNYLLHMAQCGFPLTRTMVKAYAWSMAKRSGTAHRFHPEYGPGDHWWSLFKKRHPELALRTADSLERSRAEALNPDVVKEYFDLLHKCLDSNNLLRRPRQIYNCDETFLPLDYSREKVVAAKGSKNIYRQSHGTTEHITMLCCASAAGFPLPPMIIFAKSFPGGPYRFEGPDDALYARSESGWIDSELFLSWFNKIFLKYSVPDRPIMLLTDGHKSHLTLDVVDLCIQNKIILFCLPPHTTHALQPLDVAVFKSLKDYFSKTVRALCFTKRNFVVTKKEFSKVVKTPFEKAFSIPNVKAGFKKCGIYPFNPDVVPAEKMTPSTVHKSLLSSFSSSDSSTPDPQSPSYFSGRSSDVLSVSDDAACVVHSDQSTSHSGDAPASTSHSGDAPASTSHSGDAPASTSHSGDAPASTSHSGDTPASTSHSGDAPASTSHSGDAPASTSHSGDARASTSHSVGALASTSHSGDAPASTSHSAASSLVNSDQSVILSDTSHTVSSILDTPSNSNTDPIVNPLVASGLISPDLADILVTPSGDAAVAKKRTRRIVGARDLTAEDYVDMLRKDKRRKEEAEKEKQRKKEERERKMKEREETKMKKVEAGRGRGARGRGAGRGRGTGGRRVGGKQKTGKFPGTRNARGKDKAISDESTESDRDMTLSSDIESEKEEVCRPRRQSSTSSDIESEKEEVCRPRRQRLLPTRYRSDSEDQNDGVLCIICNHNEPEELSSEMVFWIDCDVCGAWVHTYCAFGSNTVTRQFKCENCCQFFCF